MTDVKKLGKKLFTVSVVAMTIIWSMGLAALMPAVVLAAEECPTLEAGDLWKVADVSAVYVLNADLESMYFPNSEIYHTWYEDFSGVQTIGKSCVSLYPTPSSLPVGVNFRFGSMMVKRQIQDDVYAVLPGNKLAHVGSETIAKDLYGADWSKKVRDVNDAFWPNYTDKSGSVSASQPHDGMLVKVSGADIYSVDNGKLYKVDGAVPAKNKNVQTVSQTVFDTLEVASGTVTGASVVSNPTQSAVTATPPGDDEDEDGDEEEIPVGGGDLSVSLAADTPAAASLIVSDTASDNIDSSARVALAKFKFLAGSKDVTVKTLKVKQIGVNGTSDVSNMYLYEGDAFVAQYSAYSEKVYTFNSSAGLFIVPAGTSKTITVSVDMADNLNSGPTIGAQIVSADNVVIDGGSVSLSGTVSSNLMTYIAVTDFGRAQITNITPTADNNVNPGTNNFSIWSFQIAGSNQVLKFNRVKLAQAGSINKADLADLKLYEGGVQIGSTMAGLADDNSVTFDGLNFSIGKGESKTIELRANVVSGTSRTFRFMIQNVYDIDITDTSYGYLLQPDNGTEATWTVRYQGNASTVETTINAGALTVSVNPQTPTGAVAQGATQVEVAKYDFKATGEDVKVSDVYFRINSTGDEVGIDNVGMFVDGSQIGVTQDLTADNTARQWTFGSAFIVPAGETKTLLVKADMKNAAGTNLTAGSVLTPTLNSTAGSATGQTSLTAISLSSSIDASNRTVSSGDLSVAQDGSLADGTAGNPNGVTNETDVRISSFRITAGAAEGVTLNQFVIKDDGAGTYQLGDVFYNLYIKVGGVKVGDTQASLDSAGEDGSYTFTPSVGIDVSAGGSATLDVYASVLSGQSITTAEAVLDLDSISYYKKVSKSSATYTTDVVGQRVYIAAEGGLSVTLASDNYPAQIVTMGLLATDRVALAKFSLTATTEDVKIESIIIFDQMDVQGTTVVQATSTLLNFGLYEDGSSTPLNGLEAPLTATNTPNANSGYAIFNLNPNFVIPKGTTKNLTVKAQPNTYLNSSAGVKHEIILDSAVENLNSQTGSILARGAKSNTAINRPSSDLTGSAMVLYRTKPTVTGKTLVSTKMSSGSTVTLADFDVSTSPSQASLKKLTFNVSITDTTTTTGILTVDDFAIYKDNVLLTAGTDVYIFDGSGTAAADQLDTTGSGCITTKSFTLGCTGTKVETTGTGTVVVVFATEVKVPVSGANFKLKARVQNVSGSANDGDAVTLELKNDDSLSANEGGTGVTTNYSMYYLDNYPGAYYDQTAGYMIGLNSAAAGAGTAYEGYFIWSDESSGINHAYSTLSGGAGSVATAYASTESRDWTAGYRVGNLNTGISWGLTK